MQQSPDKPEILIFCDYYLPGFKSGGGMRTIVNTIDRLGDRYDFRIVTRDHDGKLDKTPYSTVEINNWNRIGKAEVFYLSKNNLRPAFLKKLIKQVSPKAIYLNGFFATPAIFVLLLRRFRQIPAVPVILAPEDELSPGALSLKPFKKKLHIAFAKAMKLYENIIWKAASVRETEDIERLRGDGEVVFIAPNMSPKMIFEDYEQSLKPQKKVNEVRLVFLSRFARKKNFKWLLENLLNIEGKLEIDVFGPIEDAEYWKECEHIIETLPENIIIQAKGSIPHEKVAETLFGYHYFILPTLSENFGHIFVEALAAGCPLIISDATPWRDLKAKGVGWDLSLENPEEWIKVLNDCVKSDQETYSRQSQSARKFAVGWLEDKELEEKTEQVIEFGLSKA